MTSIIEGTTESKARFAASVRCLAVWESRREESCSEPYLPCSFCARSSPSLSSKVRIIVFKRALPSPTPNPAHQPRTYPVSGGFIADRSARRPSAVFRNQRSRLVAAANEQGRLGVFTLDGKFMGSADLHAPVLAMKASVGASGGAVFITTRSMSVLHMHPALMASSAVIVNPPASHAIELTAAA